MATGLHYAMVGNRGAHTAPNAFQIERAAPPERRPFESDLAPIPRSRSPKPLVASGLCSS